MRGGARVETRFHFRTGITSVVPWPICVRCQEPAGVIGGRAVMVGRVESASVTCSITLPSAPAASDSRSDRDSTPKRLLARRQEQ
jgi:hypothetical protein